MTDSVNPERVTIFITCYARPQFIAPSGRWSFRIEGKDFALCPTKYNPANSTVGATNAAKRMCHRMGYEVRDIEVEDI